MIIGKKQKKQTKKQKPILILSDITVHRQIYEYYSF